MFRGRIRAIHFVGIGGIGMSGDGGRGREARNVTPPPLRPEHDEIDRAGRALEARSPIGVALERSTRVKWGDRAQLEPGAARGSGKRARSRARDADRHGSQLSRRRRRSIFIAWAVVVVAGCGGASPSPGPVELEPEVVDGAGQRYRLVPAGTFRMGAVDGEPNERPVHEVTIERPYYLGVHEVTQAAFARFARASGHRTTAEREGHAKAWAGSAWEDRPGASWRTVFSGADRPVVAVSHTDALAYAAWLTESDARAGRLPAGARYRLPSEPEWERAARGGRDRRFAGTDDPAELCAYGNVPDQSAERDGLGRAVYPCDDGVGVETAPVGRYRPNEYGLHDLSGNVWEWTADRYARYPAREPAATERRFVVRGGSFSGKLAGPRATHRDPYPPTLRGGAVGVRLVRTVPFGRGPDQGAGSASGSSAIRISSSPPRRQRPRNIPAVE